jgi:two-component system sensor histidine kinase/response regulator
MAAKATYKELEHKVKEADKHALRETEERQDIKNYVYRVRVQNGRPFETIHGPGCTEVTGYTPEDFETNPYLWIQMVHEEDRSAVEEHAVRILSGVQAGPKEHRIIRKDGAVRWVRNTPTCHYDSQGRLLSYDGRIEDISGRKSSVEALPQSEERSRAILENIEDGYYEVDIAGNLTFFNDSLCKIYGYTSEELMGMNNREYMTQETAKKTYQIFNRVYSTGEPAKIFDWEFIKKDRTTVYVEISVSLIKDSEGQAVGFRGIVREITERKRAEESLRYIQADLEKRVQERTSELLTANKGLTQEIEVRKHTEELLKKSEERYKLLAENVTDVIWTIDVNQHITYVSPSITDLLGYGVDESLGQNMKNTMTQESRKHYEAITHKVRNRLQDNGYKPFDLPSMEFEMLRRDGTQIWVEARVTFLTDHKGLVIGLLGVTRNIAERKRMEEELRRAKAEAEAATIAKSEFLASMSHEIRTPMNAITGFSDMLLDTHLDKAQIFYAKTIKSSGDALLSLLNDILDISKIEARRLDLETIEFDPELLAYDVCELMRPKIESKDIEILCRIGDNLPSYIEGDPLRLRQVLTNLMGNAVKFTEVGEVELSLDVDGTTGDRVKLHASIRDTGIGISNEKLDTIFDPFQQADNSTTRTFGGTGLGLTICKQIANLMDGDVWAESEVNKGSTFHFSGWFKKTEDKEAKRFTGKSLSGKKVLIVDDNQTNLDILTHTLESFGMNVVGLRKAEDVISTLKEALGTGNLFDLCISDIQMPGMSGFKIAEQIRGAKYPFSNLTLLALSSAMERDAKKCEESGFDGFLSKPLQRKKLFQMLNRLMGESEDEGKEDETIRHEIKTQYSVREDMKHSVRILLVEDNPINQKLAKMMLNKAGYQVEVAHDGKEAVEKYKTSPSDFDLIFMDVQMPRMDGMEATKTIRGEGFDSIPIIAMTAHAMKGDRERCLEVGMDDYISKPIKRELVFEILDKWVFNRAMS